MPEDRVVAIEDGQQFNVGSRTLLLRDTPGHAKHHYAVWDALSQGWFTGDTFGVSYRATDAEHCGATQTHYLIPTSTPVQFDPDAWAQTINMLMSYQPQRMYLTHFGMVEDVAFLADELRRKLQEYSLLAKRHVSTEQPHQALKQALTELHQQDLKRLDAKLTAEEITELYAVDLELNTQGLLFWLQHS